MTNERSTNPDERLADFTDRLMAGETPDKAAASDLDRDLASLQETVEHAWRAFQAPQPDPAMRNRIRSRLAAEWLENSPQTQNQKKDWLSSRKKNQVFLLRLTALIVVLAIVVGIVAPKLNPVLAGAAQNKGGVVLIVGVVLVVLVLVLLWQSRKP